MKEEPDSDSAAENGEGIYLFGLPAHAFRMFLILLVLSVVVVSVVQLLVPDSYGHYGRYASDAIRANLAYPMYRQGDSACRSCHLESYGEWSSGVHKTVACENCHGAAGEHTETHADPRAAMRVDESKDRCLVCHQALAARPKAFPQIPSFEAHMEDEGSTPEEEGNKCTSCHEAHDPS